MDQENQEGRTNKSPLQIVKDWWGIVLIFVAIVTGYMWLEKNFTRIEKLDSEKCSLSYEIRITKADIEFNRIDEELDLNRSELEDLLQLPDRPEELLQFRENFIKNLEGKSVEISNRKKCLSRAKSQCFQGDTNTQKCYD